MTASTRRGAATMAALLLAAAQATAATLSFQDGVSPTTGYAGTRDTKIKSDATGTNFATATTVEVDGSPDYSGLLKWDVTAIPAGSAVTAATISVNVVDVSTGTYEIYEMKRNWSETQATWNVFATGSSWQTAGASGTNDRGTAVLGTVTGSTTGIKTYTLNASGVALVQRWVATPSTNFGVVIQDYTVSDGLDFNTREIGTAANRPKLTVTYATGATPTATVTGTPTPTATTTPTPTATSNGATIVCFLGDSGTGANAVAAHNVCKNAGAQAIVHTGDLDYLDSPSQWETFVNNQVGQNFPYFYVLGNHDTLNASGYQANEETRFNRIGLTWTGTLTSHCTFDWRGIRFIMTTPGLGDASAATYIHDQAAASTAPWVLSIFHEQQHLMNVGTKGDATGWAVFEESRLQGATVWNGHEHSYGRTHLLSNMTSQVVADNTSPYTISKGASMTIQTGLGGNSIRAQDTQAGLPYWGSVYTSNQGANYGASLCTFGATGDPRRADCVFRNINGVDVDAWTMFSTR
jgi:Calcineurin-like phosphoesterase